MPKKAPKAHGYKSGAFHIWWREDQPNEIHIVSSDPLFTDPAGLRPGLWLTVSRNLKSANYALANHDRAARFLKAHDVPYPFLLSAADLEQFDHRRLSRRPSLLVEWQAKYPNGWTPPTS